MRNSAQAGLSWLLTAACATAAQAQTAPSEVWVLAADEAPSFAEAPASRWGRVGTAGGTTIFAGLDTLSGPPEARAIMTFHVRRTVSDGGLAAQHIQWRFACPARLYQQTALQSLGADLQELSVAVNTGEMAPLPSGSSIAGAIAAIACDGSAATPVFADRTAALAHGQAAP